MNQGRMKRVPYHEENQVESVFSVDLVDLSRIRGFSRPFPRQRERERERDNLCYRTKKNHARDVDDNAIASCTTSSNDFSIVGALNLSSLCPRLPFFFLFKPLRVSRTSLVRTKTGDPVYENYLIPPPGRNFILAKSVFFFLFLLSYLPSYFSLVNLRTNSRAVSRLKGECRRMKLIRLNKGRARGSKS